MAIKLNQPDWSADSHSLALSVEAEREKLLFYMILNAYWDPLDFELPVSRGGASEDLGVDGSIRVLTRLRTS